MLEKSGKLSAYITSDLRSARMKGLFKDIGSKRAHEIRTQIEPKLKNIIGNAPLRVTLTGTAELIDKNNRNLAVNIGQGLLLSFLFIMGIVFYLFRSFKIVFISLLPNFLPLLFLGGIMGWFGISMKISTAVLFTIAFGIAVDDTIHFLAQLRVERKRESAWKKPFGMRSFIRANPSLLPRLFYALDSWCFPCLVSWPPD